MLSNIRIIELLRFLYQQTDEAHAVTVSEMIEYLKSKGIPSVRQTVYTDLEALDTAGIDIVQIKSTQNRYFIGSRIFEYPELKMLVDAVASSKVISAKKSQALIQKLGQLTSIQQAEQLQRLASLSSRVKPHNEKVYYIIDSIQTAILDQHQISFQYYEYTPEKKKILKHDGYADILDAIESAKGGSALLPEVNMLLDHYTAAVRRHIVGDDNIKKLCQDFYDRHKEVLDTIYENCKTSLNPICEVAEDWCREKSEQGELIFSPQWSNNTYTRFTTETIRKLFPQHTKPISGWKTTDMAFYEIIKRENYFKITLSLCSDNLTDEQRAACDRVSQALNRPDRKEDWRWKRIRNWPRHTIESEPNSENYKEEIYRYLNTNWREIQKFENDLLNRTE